MKNLALAFCSIRPKQLTDSICDYREHEYFRSIQQIERILPDSFDLVVCENTIDDEKQLKNRELAEYLSNIEMVSLGSSGNIGTVNKGMGELLMLSSALEELDIDADLEMVILMQVQAVEYFSKSLPYLEKVYQMKPEETSIVQGIAAVYYSLNDMEKHVEYMNILKGLESKSSGDN